MSHVPSGFPTGGRLTAQIMDQILRLLPTVIRTGNGLTMRKHGRAIVIDTRRVPPKPNTGGLDIDIVAALPAIPSTPTLVYWGSSSTISGGTGDDQIWSSGPTNTLWYPTTKLTDKSGTPV